jgi:hypothetical protein
VVDDATTTLHHNANLYKDIQGRNTNFHAGTTRSIRSVILGAFTKGIFYRANEGTFYRANEGTFYRANEGTFYRANEESLAELGINQHLR